MKEKIRKALNNKLFMGIMFILIGITMMIAPEKYLNFFVLGAGILIILVAVLRTVVFIRGPKDGVAVSGFVVTVLLLAVGILCLVRPGLVIKFLYIVLGVLVFLEAMTGMIASAGVLRKAGLAWIPFFLLYLLLGCAGVLIILNPTVIATWAVYLAGGTMIASGIVDIVLFFMRRRALGYVQEKA